MVYDARRKRTVLFGGRNQTRQLSDTWEWDGSRWQLVNHDGPPPRVHSAAAFDRKKVVLFGGWDVTGPISDIWEWDGKQWGQIK